MRPRIGSLFTGYGGLDMAAEAVTGGHTVWTADIEPAVCRLLEHRYPDAPNLGDVSAVDWTTVEPVDVLTGGFPCQDLSHAGKRAGMQRGVNRSGQWGAMCRAIDALRPPLVLIENVRGLLSAEADSDMEPCPWCMGDGPDEPPLRALGAVLADLADIGYDAEWCGLRASDVGAPHGRFRVFITAHPATNTERGRWDGWPRQQRPGRRAQSEDRGSTTPDTHGQGLQGLRPSRRGQEVPEPLSGHGATPDTNRAGCGSIGRVNPGGRDTDRCGSADGPRQAPQPPAQWGDYEPAVRRWEHITGRAAPAPTDTAPKGGQRLSPKLSEWMMGLPAGWVTDTPGITRNEQLKMLGNGVVPQQAAAALAYLLNEQAAAA